MNPHDPAERPGAHLVAADLGVDDPWDLSNHHPLHDPLYVVGRMVATAAHEVDELHGDLTLAAQAAIELLKPLGRGEHASMRGSYGVLRTTGPQIELLAARRGAAYEHLTRAVSAYRRLLPEPAAPSDSPTPVQDLDLADEQHPGRDDGWAVAGERQIVALRAVEQGGLRLCLTAIGNDPYLSDGSGDAPAMWPETVERMLADGLLAKDTSTSLYDGQLLSLTPSGQAALRAAGRKPSDARPPDDTAVSAREGWQTSPRSSAALPTPAQFKALQEIERGEAVLRERSGQGSLYVHTGSDVRIAASTAEAMRTKRWIAGDTSTSLFQGQRLSLTDQGRAALSAARAPKPRVSAALSRSSRPLKAPAAPGPQTAPASPATAPSRSR